MIDENRLIGFMDVGKFRNPDEICFSENDVVRLIKNFKELCDELELNEQPKTDWIPCEVEMPKKNGYYEVTVFRYEGDENNVFDLWYEDGEWYVDEVDEETKDEFLFVHEVIAWQPLPQPYKKEGAD